MEFNALDIVIFFGFIAAVLSGGIFGDHASPISDTTIVSSLASASDHIEHVRTQAPYALLAGAVAIIGFALTGAWLAL
jgi:tetracycline resistance efflux pump